MASCSSSSNIRGQASIINPQGAYSRLFMNLDINNMNGSTIENGVTAGDVIRFSPQPFGSTGTYKKSKADNNENAEVVGVVESVSPSGIYTVVTHGLINLTGESIELKVNPLTGSTQGASGGNDIFFLSPGTAGFVQNLEPINPSQIVKPVLQRTYHPEYNYNVINYIGYAVAGDMLAENLSYVPVGSYTVVPDFVASGLVAERGYVDAREPHELNSFEYSEFYSAWENKYSSSERIQKIYYSTSISEQSANSLNTAAITVNAGQPYVASQFCQQNIYGSLVPNSINLDEKSFLVRIPAGGNLLSSDGGNVFLGNGFDIPCLSLGNVVKSEIVFSTPIITVNQNNIKNIYTNVSLESTNVDITYVPILKVKEFGAVNIPNLLLAEQVQATGTMSAQSTFSLPNYPDVQSTLDDILSRLDGVGL